jgi:acetyltransferase-like isoleucine patch superfamily enzyme
MQVAPGALVVRGSLRAPAFRTNPIPTERMQKTLSPDEAEEAFQRLRGMGIWLGNVRCLPGLRQERGIVIEPPIDIRGGWFDVREIGCFTYFGAEARLENVHSVGRFCSIAPNLKAGLPGHPTDFLSTSPVQYEFTYWKNRPEIKAYVAANRHFVQHAQATKQRREAEAGPIRIGNDVWIAEDVLIKPGVTIADGAIVAARAVVARDVRPYEIVGGVPARHIRYRFPEDAIAQLLEIRWWRYGLEALDGVDVTDIGAAIKL